MKTVSKHVDDLISGYPFLYHYLRQGVLNYKALARHIEPEISMATGEKVSVGAIAVSLQRIHKRDQHVTGSRIGRLRGVDVITDVIAYSGSAHTGADKILAELLTVSSVASGFAVAIRANQETQYFMEKTMTRDFNSIAQKYGLKKEDQVFAALTITREILNEGEVGGLSYPLGVLTYRGIFVRAITATFNEEVIIVNDNEADLAASVLRKKMWR